MSKTQPHSEVLKSLTNLYKTCASYTNQLIVECTKSKDAPAKSVNCNETQHANDIRCMTIEITLLRIKKKLMNLAVSFIIC